MSFDPKDWTIVMPWIAPVDNLTACLSSMGDIPAPMILVDNSPECLTMQMQLHPNIEKVCHPENWGCPRSWNLALERGTKWTLIVSASMRFGKGLTAFLEGASKRASAYGLNPRMALHLYVVGRATVDEIGFFDPHYYPTYSDDCSFWRRCILAGITGDGRSEFPYYHPDDVTSAGDALALKSGAIHPNFQANQDYYKRKWGGEPTQETFTHPFNHPELPLTYIGDPPE